ncbi:MAG: LysE family transporter [Chthoniobacterales bacterium]
MTSHTWLAFLAASILISVSPGAGAVATMTSGLNNGHLRSLWTIFGLQLGLLFQVAVVGFGIGAFAMRSETIFQVMKWVGILYLVWLGIQCWRSKDDAPLETDETASMFPGRQVLEAAIVNITNPKAYLFMIAILPQFINLSKKLLPQFSLMTVTMIVVDTVVMNGYAFFASQAARFLKDAKHRKLLNKFFGLLFIAAAFILAWVKRVG